MKKSTILVIYSVIILIFTGCSDGSKVNQQNKWDCSVFCAEESTLDEYVITYSDEKVTSQVGTLTFENGNDFAIKVYLTSSGAEVCDEENPDEAEHVMEIPAGGVYSLKQIKKDIIYIVGIHADVHENTEIKLMVYDGAQTKVNVS